MPQNYTDNCFDPNNVAQTDLQNIEGNFAALKSQFSGAGAPANPVPGMPWIDLTRHMLCVRNEANNAWLDIFNLATGQSANLPTASDSVLGGVKIGARLSIAAGVLAADVQAPPYPIAVDKGGTGATAAGAAADNLAVVKQDHGYGQIGSLVFGSATNSVSYGPGDTIAGSLLKAVGILIAPQNGGGSARETVALSGTWRCLGICETVTWGYEPDFSSRTATLWQRIE